MAIHSGGENSTDALFEEAKLGGGVSAVWGADKVGGCLGLILGVSSCLFGVFVSVVVEPCN